MDQRRVIVILGMHRSGTSCLAGSLQQAGLYLGDVVTTAPHNLKGNRENRRIMDLHDRILGDSGGAWDDPPQTVAWNDAHRAARDAILDEYRGRDLWGFKDPRTLLVLSGWLEVLPHVSHVATFRHPSAVAASLTRRNGRTEEQWLALWAYYNERLLSLHRARPFPILDFDLEDARYQRSLLGAARELGLVPGSPLDFFEPSLRRNRLAPDHPVPRSVRALYEELKARALDG